MFGIIKKNIKKLHHLNTRRKLVQKINLLDIRNSGVDDEGDPFVGLADGTLFYGLPLQRAVDAFLYCLLDEKTKKVLKKECLQVAMDIVIRYMEGGLQYGGPRKQSEHVVRKGEIAVEMGGYQGFCSLKLARQVGPAGKVVSIEPMPDNFRLLEKNKMANHLDNLIIVNKGVWDEPSWLTFNRRKGDGQSSSIEMEYENADQFKIQADCLDNIFQSIGIDKVDFMVVQLNGAEINALRGLTRFKPTHLSIAARYDTEGCDAAVAIKELLESRGYAVKIKENDFVFARLK